MKMNARLEDISDGRLYELNDLVKADTRGCEGCSACCHDMGESIVLNPYDLYQLLEHTKMNYHDLIGNKIDVHDEEKILIPHLKMSGPRDACSFLGEDERCTVHSLRPGICRLFPLGRYYEEDDFKYIFKPGECVKPNLSKVKVKKWIGIVEYPKNKAFILSWHQLIKALRWRLKFVKDKEELEEINDYLVDTFYNISWEAHPDFYDYYNRVLPAAKDRLGIL